MFAVFSGPSVALPRTEDLLGVNKPTCVQALRSNRSLRLQRRPGPSIETMVVYFGVSRLLIRVA